MSSREQVPDQFQFGIRHLLWLVTALAIFLGVGIFLIRINGPQFTSLDDHKILAASLRVAPKIGLYEGLPHQHLEPKLLDDELKSRPTFRIEEFPFYRGELELSATDAQSIQALLCEIQSFEPLNLRAPKSCGGFHPDFCVTWQSGGKTYYALLCFGCCEMKAFGDGVELHCGIREATLEALMKICMKYRKNRPTTRVDP